MQRDIKDKNTEIISKPINYNRDESFLTSYSSLTKNIFNSFITIIEKNFDITKPENINIEAPNPKILFNFLNEIAITTNNSNISSGFIYNKKESGIIKYAKIDYNNNAFAKECSVINNLDRIFNPLDSNRVINIEIFRGGLSLYLSCYKKDNLYKSLFCINEPSPSEQNNKISYFKINGLEDESLDNNIMLNFILVSSHNDNLEIDYYGDCYVSRFLNINRKIDIKGLISINSFLPNNNNYFRIFEPNIKISNKENNEFNIDVMPSNIKIDNNKFGIFGIEYKLGDYIFNGEIDDKLDDIKEKRFLYQNGKSINIISHLDNYRLCHINGILQKNSCDNIIISNAKMAIINTIETEKCLYKNNNTINNAENCNIKFNYKDNRYKILEITGKKNDLNKRYEGKLTIAGYESKGKKVFDIIPHGIGNMVIESQDKSFSYTGNFDFFTPKGKGKIIIKDSEDPDLTIEAIFIKDFFSDKKNFAIDFSKKIAISYNGFKYSGIFKEFNLDNALGGIDEILNVKNATITDLNDNKIIYYGELINGIPKSQVNSNNKDKKDNLETKNEEIVIDNLNITNLPVNNVVDSQSNNINPKKSKKKCKSKKVNKPNQLQIDNKIIVNKNNEDALESNFIFNPADIYQEYSKIEDFKVINSKISHHKKSSLYLTKFHNLELDNFSLIKFGDNRYFIGKVAKNIKSKKYQIIAGCELIFQELDQNIIKIKMLDINANNSGIDKEYNLSLINMINIDKDNLLDFVTNIATELQLASDNHNIADSIVKLLQNNKNINNDFEILTSLYDKNMLYKNYDDINNPPI
jgi:hypothetical protein